MKSTRIAPFDDKLDKRYDINKKISLQPSTSNNNDNTTASLPASLSPADKHSNEDDCIKREKTIAKTASCPTQVFPTTSEIILNKNHVINSKANSKRRLPSGRIRSLSIPPDSTDAMRLDFFGSGDTTIYQRYSPPSPSPLLNSTTGDCKRVELGMLHENEVLNGDTEQMRDDTNRVAAAVCNKQNVSTRDIPKIENDKHLIKEERLDSTQTSAPMKCQCIII